jgi:hypothetical protein
MTALRIECEPTPEMLAGIEPLEYKITAGLSEEEHAWLLQNGTTVSCDIPEGQYLSFKDESPDLKNTPHGSALLNLDELKDEKPISFKDFQSEIQNLIYEHRGIPLSVFNEHE